MVDKTSASLADMLRTSGFSMTGSRRKVFEALFNEEPMSMHELIVKVGGGADKASIYRSIVLYEKLGIVQRLNHGWKYKLELTDKFSEHHHHMSCISCGRVISINEDRLESFIRRTAGDNGFVATSHQVEVQGYCSLCADQPAADQRPADI